MTETYTMSQNEDVLTFIKLIGIVRTRDLAKQDIKPFCISKLVKEEKIKRIGNGLYCASDYRPSTQQALVQISLLVPNATISLLSALYVHEIVVRLPTEIWITLPSDAHTPMLEIPRIQAVRSSLKNIELGRERHLIDDVQVYIYSPERTIVDCFKFRRLVGIDLALEALRNGLRKKKAKLDTIQRIATQLRLSSILAPYIESVQFFDGEP